MITPKDIEKKVFSSGIKGYRRDEVDQFLDELMVEVQALIQENEHLRSNIQDLRKEVENRKESETSIMRTLEQAKGLMSDISASAEKRADAIVRNAQAEAARMLNEAKDSVASLNAEGERVRSKVKDFKDRYRMMLRDELRKIESGSDDFFLEHGEDFYPASMELESVPDAPAEELDVLSDAEQLFREIEAETENAPLNISDTRGGIAAGEFKTEVVDDLAKTLVLDEEELARISRE